VIEAINSPPEECQLSAPCSFGELWSPNGEEHDYATNQPAVEPVAETGGAGTDAVHWGYSGTATGLPVGHRYRHGAALYRVNSAWMGPLTLRSIKTSPSGSPTVKVDGGRRLAARRHLTSATAAAAA